MTIKEKVILFFATGFYTGKTGFAPGTFGTLAGIPFAVLIPQLYSEIVPVYVVAIILFAIWIADRAESILGQKDPGCIVIDEIAGYVLAMTVVPISFFSIIAGFFIFRFFDIVKPFPVRFFEKNFSGGAGVVLDDVCAGVYSAFVLKMMYMFDIF